MSSGNGCKLSSRVIHSSPQKLEAFPKCLNLPGGRAHQGLGLLVPPANRLQNQSKGTLEHKSVQRIWGLRAFQPPCYLSLQPAMGRNPGEKEEGRIQPVTDMGVLSTRFMALPWASQTASA